jgi:hypothetical protein
MVLLDMIFVAVVFSVSLFFTLTANVFAISGEWSDHSGYILQAALLCLVQALGKERLLSAEFS